jgi:acyl-CoA thioesterase FadM
MKRYYSYTHTVRYDECNCDGLLTPTTFLRYMQELAARDARDAHLEGGGYWVVKRTVMSFTAPVQVYSTLELKTYGIGFTRITAQRGYEARLVGQSQEEPIISARTLWVYVDARGRPTRLPERTEQIWLPDGHQPQMAEEPLSPVPEGQPARSQALVSFSDIDLMRHLNNASAVEMLDNAAWEIYANNGITPDSAAFDALHYDIEYAESPRFGETLEIHTWLDARPRAGQEFTRLQDITRAGKIMVRARSRWLWRADSLIPS